MPEFSIVVTEELHNMFRNLSGDESLLHTDDDYCATTKFKERIGYAFLLTALLSRLYGSYMYKEKSICVKQEASFVKPFFIGDELRVVGEVVSYSPSTRLAEISSVIIRNGAEVVFRGKGLVQLL